MDTCIVCNAVIDDWVLHVFKQRVDTTHKQFIEDRIKEYLPAYLNLFNSAFPCLEGLSEELSTLFLDPNKSSQLISIEMLADFAYMHGIVPRVTLFKWKQTDYTLPDLESELLTRKQAGDLLYLSSACSEKIERAWKSFYDTTIKEVRTCSYCGESALQMIEVQHTNCCARCLELVENSPWVSVSKKFKFAAAHQLPYHSGLCQYLHGHEWEFTVTCKAPNTNSDGILIDFSDLKRKVNDVIISRLDHNLLNLHISNPTAENICQWIFKRLRVFGNMKFLTKVEVWESRGSHATFEI